jgi:hypothetical protein
MYENEASPLDAALVDTFERGEELILRAQVVGQSMYELVRALAGADSTLTETPAPAAPPNEPVAAASP